MVGKRLAYLRSEYSSDKLSALEYMKIKSLPNNDIYELLLINIQ